MNKIIFGMLVSVIAAGMSLAQNSAQASGAASQGGTVSVDQLGTQAQSGTTANANGKAAAGNAASASDQVQAGSIIYAELEKSLDARKAKVGDPVVAKVLQAVLSKGKVVAPKGSRILGHVTQVKARSKGEAKSELGLAFDRIVLKDRSEIPVAMTIQAIGNGAAATSFSPDTDPSMSGPMSGNPGLPGHSNNTGALGGAAGTVGDVAQTAGNATGTVADSTAASTGRVGAATSAHVGASSHGIVGMPDLTLSAATSNSVQGSLITSDKKNVKLDSGSELVLRVQ